MSNSVKNVSFFFINILVTSLLKGRSSQVNNTHVMVLDTKDVSLALDTKNGQQGGSYPIKHLTIEPINSFVGHM